MNIHLFMIMQCTRDIYNKLLHRFTLYAYTETLPGSRVNQVNHQPCSNLHP